MSFIMHVLEEKAPGSGGHRSEPELSFTNVTGAFIPAFFIACFYLVIFVVLRRQYPNIYFPRTFLGIIPERDRTPTTAHGKSSWLAAYTKLDDTFILRHQSLDAYLFMRFLRILVFICTVGGILTWLILIPVNATGGGNAKQLDKLGYGNVADKNRLWAHAIVACVYFSFVMFVIARERMMLIGLKQAYLLAGPQSKRLSSRTVLFLAAPKAALREENLKRIFGDEARRHWVVAPTENIDSLVSDRTDTAMDLEAAETKFLQRIHKDKGESHSSADDVPEEVSTSMRPTTKKPIIIGKTLDKIKHLTDEIKHVDDKIQEARAWHNPSRDSSHDAIFVEFSSQAAAHRAVQQVTYSEPLALQPRFVGVQPKEVLWGNLTIAPAARIFSNYVAYGLVIAITIFWVIPVGLVGTISNIDYLVDQFHWLSFIYNLPDGILNFIRGFLSPYLVSELVSYVPKMFRNIAKKAGEPTTAQAELKTQKWYFIFQVIQVFLVTTVTSGVTTVISRILDKPTSVPNLLAENLPKASNFYLTYFILQGLASPSNMVLNTDDLFEYVAFGWLFDRTPRDHYKRYTDMKGLSYGKPYPKFTNFAVIALSYACIQPLVVGFAAAGIFFYYLSYRYNLLFVIQNKIDTKGENYSLALQQLLTGVYLAELCLLGLFGTSLDAGPSVILVLLIIATVIYHVTMNRYLNPLELYLPMDLLSENEQEQPLLDNDEEEGSNEGSRLLSRLPHRIRDSRAGGFINYLVTQVEQFFEPHIHTARKQMYGWLTDTRDPHAEAEDPEYTEDQLKNAYVNPSLTSGTPKLWLPRDGLAFSEKEIAALKESGITATHDGAELDEKGKIKVDYDHIDRIPIFKKAVQY